MYLPVEPGRLIEGPVNRGPENRGCTVLTKKSTQLTIYAGSFVTKIGERTLGDLVHQPCNTTFSTIISHVKRKDKVTKESHKRGRLFNI